MDTTELTVRGEHASRLPAALREIPDERRFDYQGDGFAVIVTERFYYRINASVQTTVVFELVDDEELAVTVVSGGGAAGLAREDAGAESAASRAIVRRMEQFCRQRGLDVETETRSGGDSATGPGS